MGPVQVNFKYGINENLAGGKLDLGSEGQGGLEGVSRD